MCHKLETDILSNQKRYFFSLLGPRFAPMNSLMATALSRRFGGTYEPIEILSAPPNELCAGRNYIVINEKARELAKSFKEPPIFLQEYEDLNQEFLRHPLIQRLTEDLKAKQGCVPVYPFTTSFLESSDPGRFFLIGPDPKLATKYDDKIEQYLLFTALDLPRVDAWIAPDFATLESSLETFPVYVSASFSSGGAESSMIIDAEHLRSFYQKLRPENKGNRFLVSAPFDGIVALPNVTAYITGNGSAHVISITDQVLRGNTYLGNVYPSCISEALSTQIKTITLIVGEFLAARGFRGLFGCDFLIDNCGRVAIVDLNPRRQGGYLCCVLALRSVGIDLTDLELQAALGERTETDLSWNRLQYPGAWAHSKIKPYQSGSLLNQELTEGDPFAVFENKQERWVQSFYKRGARFVSGYVGYCVVAGIDRIDVDSRITESTNDLLSRITFGSTVLPTIVQANPSPMLPSHSAAER